MTSVNQQIMPRSLEQLVRPNVKALVAYPNNRSDFKKESKILLDANENPYGSCNRYPDADQMLLKTRISKIKKIAADQIVLGNGSDEIIDLCFRLFCTPGVDKAVTYGPTYSMYAHVAKLNDVDLLTLPLDNNFQADPVMLEQLEQDETVKLLLLCSPNNPTANSIDQLETLVGNFRGITLIDEAYIEFSERTGFLSRITEFPNVIICQTFSKAWGKAGARVGMGFASARIISLMNAIRFPYNVSMLNQTEVLSALDDEQSIKQQVVLILKERTRMLALLSQNPGILEVYPSDANFILVKTSAADEICNALRTKGILVRNQSHAIPGCIRISIGAETENDRLIQALDELAKEYRS